MQFDSPTFVEHELTKKNLKDKNFVGIINKYKKKGIVKKNGDFVIIPRCNQENCAGEIKRSFITVDKDRVRIKWSNIIDHCKKKHPSRYQVWRR